MLRVYRIKDSRGNIIIDGDGTFGSEASHLFSIEVGENIKETKQEICRIYPNPAKDFVKLSAVGGQLSMVRIFNSLGVLVSEMKINSNEVEIDISNYKSGIYFIQIYSDDKVNCRKIAKL